MDNKLATHALKKSCAFILDTGTHLKTLAMINELLVLRKIEVLFLQFQVFNESHATIILHCRLERDKIKFIAQQLRNLNGVNKIEWMEDTAREKQY